MIIGDPAFANYQVVREHTPNRLMETATYSLIRNLERRERLSVARPYGIHRLFDTVHPDRGRVCLKVGTGAIPFDRITPLWNAPGEFYFRFCHGFWQSDSDRAVAGSFDITNVNKA